MSYLFSFIALIGSLINYYLWSSIKANPYWSVGMIFQILLLMLALLSLMHFQGVKLKIHDKKYKRVFMTRLLLLITNLVIVGLIALKMCLTYF
ncbi:MAG: hypothetical protein LBS33_01360 [Streptococcaceae bacterium]|jgi:hypothetical protein|nr:hypothetical protein [Streptococcaceae bacterium]